MHGNFGAILTLWSGLFVFLIATGKNSLLPHFIENIYIFPESLIIKEIQVCITYLNKSKIV